jgi:diguanylate cyclase (GGDEF)-like protein/PAS domain S-box-containing protein
MNDHAGINKELLEEISVLQQRIRELEQSESECKRIEEALRESQAFYHSLVEQLPAGVFRKDREGRYVFVSPWFCRLKGMKEEEFLGKTPQEVAASEAAKPGATEQAIKYAAEGADHHVRIMQAGNPLELVEEYTDATGRKQFVHVIKIPVLNSEGKVIGTQGILFDITEHRRMEEALSDSEERYRRIIEASSDAVLLRSKESIVYANPAALKLFRANHPENLIGKRYLDLVHPDDLATSTERVKKTLEENWIAPPREHRLLALDGQVVHVESTGVPVKYRGETHVFGIFRDITERKLAEQEKAILAGIERLIGSTLEIDEVYDRFAAEARKMIPFDRLTINLNNHDQRTVTVTYVFGPEVSGRSPGDSFPLQGSVNEALERTKTGMILHPMNVDEITGQYSHLSSAFQAGIRSFMGVPLISRDKVIGVLNFRSKKPDAYKEQDLRLAEMIGVQIAGAIANAQLYASLKKIEQELKESEQRYRELSIVDDLTRLYNSRYFYHQLKTEIDRSNRYEQPLTLLLLDLDNFKGFNDAYGHVEGDQVLWRLGHVIKRCLRETDFAFRYGGEEFTILLPMTTKADGAVTAERIRTEFKKETFSPAPDQDAHVTVSIGLAQYQKKEDMKAFVHRADQLMYQGKKNGKDRVCSES